MTTSGDARCDLIGAVLENFSENSAVIEKSFHLFDLI